MALATVGGSKVFRSLGEIRGLSMSNLSIGQKSVRLVVLAIAAFVLLQCVAGTAFAQRTTASVTGSIVDPSEAAVPGTSVVVRNLSTGAERTVESSELGYYVVTALPAGPYSMTVSKTGFQTQTVPQLVLEVDQNATINISLKIGGGSETVDVTAEVAAIDTRTATLNTVISQKQVNDLPLNGRNVLQLMQLTPGTLQGTGTFNQAATRPESGSQMISASGGEGTPPRLCWTAGSTKIPTPQWPTWLPTRMRSRNLASRPITTRPSFPAAAAAWSTW